MQVECFMYIKPFELNDDPVPPGEVESLMAGTAKKNACLPIMPVLFSTGLPRYLIISKFCQFFRTTGKIQL